MTDAYRLALKGYVKRGEQQIAINGAKIKFLEEILWMRAYELITFDEWEELYDMVRGDG